MTSPLPPDLMDRPASFAETNAIHDQVVREELSYYLSRHGLVVEGNETIEELSEAVDHLRATRDKR